MSPSKAATSNGLLPAAALNPPTKNPPGKRVHLRDGSDDDAPNGSPVHGSLLRRQGSITDSPSSVSSSRKKQRWSKEEREEAARKRLERAAELRVVADKLPFNEAKDRIVQEILKNDSVIIVADTGSGKSTQLPQLLQTHPDALTYFANSSASTGASPHPARQRKPQMAITQPRRLPCISLADRVSAEMGVELGREVGYAVRFESKEIGEDVARPISKKARTYVRFCTEGVLLRELSNRTETSRAKTSAGGNDQDGQSSASSVQSAADRARRLLLRYDVIVVDEAHERTVNTDLLLGTLKSVQAERKQWLQRIETAKALRDGTVNGHTNGHAANGNGSAHPSGQSDMEDEETDELQSSDHGKAAEEDQHEDVLSIDWGPYEMRELKIVIMSATINTEKFSVYLNKAPILAIDGRTYPVHTYHLPTEDDRDLEAMALQAVAQIAMGKEEGDILVFMPGYAEIEQLVQLLQTRYNGPILKQAEANDPGGKAPLDKRLLEIHSLYRAMNLSDQSKVLERSKNGLRKVIVATNIAETSLTIENVKFVVDSGLQKERNIDYIQSTAISNLQARPCSQSAARQRTGRAGRTAAGWCYRLYTESDFAKREIIQSPEIQRAELQNLFLQLVAIGQQPFRFDFIDPPDKNALIQAFSNLLTFGAVTNDFKLTAIGQRMLHYPVQPAHARILLAGFELGSTAEVIDILAIMEAGDPFAKTSNHEAADLARQRFVHREGDHLTNLKVLRAAVEAGQQRKTDPTGFPTLQRWCKDHSLNEKGIREALNIRTQLRKLVQEDGHSPDLSAGDDAAPVLRAMLSGLSQYVAEITENKTYKQHGSGQAIKIHPSSVLAGKLVPAFVFDELEITSDIYARNCSAIDLNWVVQMSTERIQRAQQRPSTQD